MKYSIIETGWIIIGMTVVLLVIYGIFSFISADRLVRYYYIGEGTLSSDQLLFKVVADIDWYPDEVAATFTDPNEALEFMSNANEALNR